MAFRPRSLSAWAALRSLIALLFVLIAGTPAAAKMDDPLETRLAPEVVQSFFPGAATLDGFDTDPPVAQVIDGDGELLGYLFSTHETVQPAGFAGASFDIVVAMDPDGVLVGHAMLEQYEPLVHEGMVPPSRVSAFLRALDGSRISPSGRAPTGDIDGVAGVTISAMAMHQAILASARKVGHMKGVLAASDSGLAMDRFAFTEKDWPALLADGAIGHLRVSAGALRAALADTGADTGADTAAGTATGTAANSRAASRLPADDDAPAIDLYMALATPPLVGRNLFGSGGFREMTKYAQAGEQQLFIGSVGGFRWIPRNPHKVEQFDRLRLVQDGTVIPLLTEYFNRARGLAAAGAPRFDYAGRFRLPRSSGFDPLKPWTLELTVGDRVFPLRHHVPPDHVIGSDFEKEEAGLQPIETALLGTVRVSTLNDWQLRWLDNQGAIAGLLALLAAVTSVLLFQHRLTRWRRPYRVLRLTLLAVTLGWLGWWTGNQLSILTLMNYAQLAFTGGDWGPLLFDPLVVILSAFTLVSLVLWGRGVFCGWLCPFGALQELLNQLARALSVPQVTIAPALHERLWAVKYIVAAGLGVAAILSMETATDLAEVEPFKTAISVHFARAWPFVAYAGALLLIGLFIERAFCRFLCPLGAVLALAGRVHVLNWLPRRPQCGSPCQICRNSCPVGAVEPSGRINMTECFQCLDCQVDYHDVTRCPPLVSRQRRLKALAA